MTTYLPTVTDATVIGDHRLRVVFDDGFVELLTTDDRSCAGPASPAATTSTPSPENCGGRVRIFGR